MGMPGHPFGEFARREVLLRQRAERKSTLENESEDHDMTINEIMKLLPHRYPMLLVDRILEIAEDGKRIVGLKNVSANEQFFQGHFPGAPVMPGVLIVEAMAQCAAVLFLREIDGPRQEALPLRRRRQGPLPQAGRAGRSAHPRMRSPAAARRAR